MAVCSLMQFLSTDMSGTELMDTGRVDPRVGLGRVRSRNLYNLPGRVGSSDQICQKICVKCFSETTHFSAVAETSHLLYL